MTREEFEDKYGHPFEVDGINLEDVQSIYPELYKPKLLACTSIDEMRDVVRKFGFLTARANRDIENMTDLDAAVIKLVLTPEVNFRVRTTTKALAKYANVMLPPVMLQAYLIAKRFDIPEYYAALQYVRAVSFREHLIEE